MPNIPLISWNAGEVSPKIDARADIEKYASACRTLENMICLIYGIAERRPGTEYMWEAKYSPQGVRMIDFIYSATIAYICEFGNLYARFGYDGALLLDDSDNPVEVVTPYLVADLPELQYDQIGDTMWLVHEHYAPRKLTRTTATSFSLDEIVFETGPFMTRNDILNDDGITLTSSATTVGSTGTLTASGAVFDALHVGALFQLTHPRAVTSVTIAAAATSDAIDVKGDFTWSTHGTWTGVIHLERSENGADWEIFRTQRSSEDANIQFTTTESEDDVQYRTTIVAGVTGTVSSDINVHDSTQEGIVRIDAVGGTTSATITVLSAVASTDATTRWAEGCWSAYRGYPRAISFFENRAVYGGTTHQPHTIWLSKTDDYENFDAGTLAADSFSVTIATTDHIRWIAGLKSLIIGTSGAPWVLRSNKLDTPITPTSYSIKQYTTYGSAPMQALKVNDVVLFVDYVRKKVREFTPTDEYYGSYAASDLNALAEHITESGIVAMAHQKNPDSILWSVRTDGILLSMTYEREQNTIGWARHLVCPSQVDTSGYDWTTSGRLHYPILRELTAEEIPVKPTEPADTPLSGETEITTAVGLQTMAGSGHYSLKANIDLTGVTWTPIANFSGVLEGNGHTISNLTITSSGDNKGLFANLNSGAHIRNLTLDSFTITADDEVGALAGIIDTQANIKISHVTVSNTTITADTYVGGLIGDIFDCTVGINIFDCHAHNVTITAASGWAGGLVGDWDMNSSATGPDYLVDCSVTGESTITASSDGYIGGMLGYITGRNAGRAVFIHSCYVDSTVTITTANAATQAIGGFAGVASTILVTSSYSKATITITKGAGGESTEFIGGFLGTAGGVVIATNCYATGAINIYPTDGDSCNLIGGFVGKCDTTSSQFLRCYSTGTITIDNDLDVFTYMYDIGGFAGSLLGPALVGTDRGWFKRCFTWSDIAVTNMCVTQAFGGTGIGGFAGGANRYPTIVENCYAWGSITADNTKSGAKSYNGGFIGGLENSIGLDANITFKNCYAAQTNSKFGSGLSNQLYDNGAGEVGGFLGYDGDATYNAVCTACYWDTETADVTADDSVGAVGHITLWMMTKTNFELAGWNLTTIWEMAEGSTTLSIAAEGTVSTVARIPSVSEDEIWLASLLDINGTPRRYIMRMKPRKFDTIEDAFFVDCGLTIINDPASATITGLDHLIGEEVVVLGDGVVYTPTAAVDATGSVTISTAVSKAQVGLRFRYKLKTIRPDMTTAQGTTQASLAKIAEMGVSFLNTMNAKYGVDYTNLYDFDWTNPMWVNATEITGLFTGIVGNANVDGGFSIEHPLIITGDDPYPCTVRAIIPKMNVTGR